MIASLGTATPRDPVLDAVEPPARIDLLRGARLADGARVDVRLRDGRVTDLAAGGLEVEDPAATVDLDGWLLLTAPAEPHAHLDKALSFELIDPPLGDLPAAAAAWRAYAETATRESILERARAQALAMLAHGITAIRTHVDVHPGFPTRSAEALIQLRDELSEHLDMQIVALASSFATREDIEAVLDLGVELVGGAPHMAPDPDAEVERLVGIAVERGLGIDLHTDENLDGPLTLPHYLRLIRDRPRRRDYAASHCVRLGTLPPAELAEIVAEVLSVELGVISLPVTNLYLQDWRDASPTLRGLPPLRTLIDAGARVCAGADNVRDPFNPMGRSCAFETASALVSAAHVGPAEAWHMVSDGAREVIGLPPAGPRLGADAELLAVRAHSLTEAVAAAPADRFVIHRGRLIARSELRCTMAAPDPSAATGVR